MRINLDRRVKMIPVMEINAGDTVAIGGFDYMVEDIYPCKEKNNSGAYGIRLVMSSYKDNNLVRRLDSVFSVDSILVFLPKGDSVVVECSYRELEECFPKM